MSHSVMLSIVSSSSAQTQKKVVFQQAIHFVQKKQ